MTNARDLENGMIADPEDNRVSFGTDFKGEAVYYDQKVWMYNTVLIADEDKEKWLYTEVVEHNNIAYLVGKLVDEVSMADVFEWLTSDSYVDVNTMMEIMGATVVNEGDAS